MTAITPLEEDVKRICSVLACNPTRLIGTGTLYRAIESALSIRDKDEKKGVIEGLVEAGYVKEVDLSELTRGRGLHLVLYEFTQESWKLLAEKPEYGVLPK